MPFLCVIDLDNICCFLLRLIHLLKHDKLIIFIEGKQTQCEQNGHHFSSNLKYHVK